MLGALNRGALARTMVGVVVVALIPWPASAGETATPPRPSLRTALAEVGTRHLGPAPPSQDLARRSQQNPDNPPAQSASFFKTRTGVIVAVVTAAGTGYAIYSAHHDRIHSAGKK